MCQMNDDIQKLKKSNKKKTKVVAASSSLDMHLKIIFKSIMNILGHVINALFFLNFKIAINSNSNVHTPTSVIVAASASCLSVHSVH